MIFLSEAFSLTLFLLAFFALHHVIIIPAEEEFLKEKLGEGLTFIVTWFRNTFPWLCPGEGSHSGGIFPSANLAPHLEFY